MEKIQLSSAQLSSLYKKNLVLTETAPQQNVTDHKQVIYFGGYQKKILWLHTEPNHPYLSDDDHEMVSKILEACRLSWNDIARVNMSPSGFSIEDVLAQLLPSCLIISLPYDTAHACTQTDLYATQDIQHIQSMRTDILKDIRGNKDLKVKLWQGLKAFFQL